MVKLPVTGYSPLYNGPEGQEDMPWLLTAGPVVTSRTVKLAMLADWSVRDAEFLSLARRATEQVLDLMNAADGHDCIMVNMSGMAALECILGGLSPAGRKRQTVVAASGPGATQAGAILTHLKRPWTMLAARANSPVSVRQLENALKDNPGIHTVVLVQTDATTGLACDVDAMAHAAKAAGKTVVVDARTSLGALPLDLSGGHIDAVLAVPFAALGGVAGFSLIIAARDLLGGKLAASPSASLDLFELWNTINSTGQFPGTPPAQAICAFNVALRELDLEGGPAVRLARFSRVHQHLLAGMKKLGFQPKLPDLEKTCGFITAFARPADPYYDAEGFSQRLRQQGFVIMDEAGQGHGAGGFRIATMGQIDEDVVRLFLAAVEKVMRETGMRSGAPDKG
jgi:2-aminoethylphosphonate-pyruvate transaminase